VLKEKPKESQQMSEFGRTVYSLMLTRGIETRQKLREALNTAGYEISQARLSYYLNGQRNVDAKFVVCVADLLKLNKKERQELAWVFAYGQG
jgi:hypothetical protein